MTLKEKKLLKRREKKLISKLGTSKVYLIILGIFVFLFSPIKHFIVIPKKGKNRSKKETGVLSYSIYRFFGFTIGYIDDFIVHSKLRGAGVGKQLFNKALDKIKEKKGEYALLVADKDRKVAHRFYKKAGFKIINLGLFIFAYKKLKKGIRKK